MGECEPRQQQGFTLIELSIVLVIIGLLVGGIVAGQQLIVTANVTAQASQLQRYSSAVNTFRDKYGALPGDISTSNALQFSLPNNCCTGGNHANGNGLFDSTATLGQYGIVNTDEEGFFWPDLSLTGLIEGSLSCPGYTICPGLPGSVRAVS